MVHLYRIIEHLNGEKNGKRVLFDYRTWQRIKVFILVYLIKP